MEIQLIHQKIHEIRGQKVMLDFDLAILYGIEAKRLKASVRRNAERFPPDFMFELTRDEMQLLRTQNASLRFHGQHPKYLPFAFTEQGVAMLSGILNSPKAIQTNISIMRAFVEMRHFGWTLSDFAQKLAEIEAKMGLEIADIHEVLRWLGTENQTRADEISELSKKDQPIKQDWENRNLIGFNPK